MLKWSSSSGLQQDAKTKWKDSAPHISNISKEGVAHRRLFPQMEASSTTDNTRFVISNQQVSQKPLSERRLVGTIPRDGHGSSLIQDGPRGFNIRPNYADIVPQKRQGQITKPHFVDKIPHEAQNTSETHRPQRESQISPNYPRKIQLVPREIFISERAYVDKEALMESSLFRSKRLSISSNTTHSLKSEPSSPMQKRFLLPAMDKAFRSSSLSLPGLSSEKQSSNPTRKGVLKKLKKIFHGRSLRAKKMNEKSLENRIIISSPKLQRRRSHTEANIDLSPDQSEIKESIVSKTRLGRLIQSRKEQRNLIRSLESKRDDASKHYIVEFKDDEEEPIPNGKQRKNRNTSDHRLPTFSPRDVYRHFPAPNVTKSDSFASDTVGMITFMEHVEKERGYRLDCAPDFQCGLDSGKMQRSSVCPATDEQNCGMPVCTMIEDDLLESAQDHSQFESRGFSTVEIGTLQFRDKISASLSDDNSSHFSGEIPFLRETASILSISSLNETEAPEQSMQHAVVDELKVISPDAGRAFPAKSLLSPSLRRKHANDPTRSNTTGSWKCTLKENRNLLANDVCIKKAEERNSETVAELSHSSINHNVATRNNNNGLYSASNTSSVTLGTKLFIKQSSCLDTRDGSECYRSPSSFILGERCSDDISSTTNVGLVRKRINDLEKQTADQAAMRSFSPKQSEHATEANLEKSVRFEKASPCIPCEIFETNQIETDDFNTWSPFEGKRMPRWQTQSKGPAPSVESFDIPGDSQFRRIEEHSSELDQSRYENSIDYEHIGVPFVENDQKHRTEDDSRSTGFNCVDITSPIYRTDETNQTNHICNHPNSKLECSVQNLETNSGEAVTQVNLEEDQLDTSMTHYDNVVFNNYTSPQHSPDSEYTKQNSYIDKINSSVSSKSFESTITIINNEDTLERNLPRYKVDKTSMTVNDSVFDKSREEISENVAAGQNTEQLNDSGGEGNPAITACGEDMKQSQHDDDKESPYLAHSEVNRDYLSNRTEHIDYGRKFNFIVRDPSSECSTDYDGELSDTLTTASDTNAEYSENSQIESLSLDEKDRPISSLKKSESVNISDPPLCQNQSTALFRENRAIEMKLPKSSMHVSELTLHSKEPKLVSGITEPRKNIISTLDSTSNVDTHLRLTKDSSTDPTTDSNTLALRDFRSAEEEGGTSLSSCLLNLSPSIEEKNPCLQTKTPRHLKTEQKAHDFDDLKPFEEPLPNEKDEDQSESKNIYLIESQMSFSHQHESDIPNEKHDGQNEPKQGADSQLVEANEFIMPQCALNDFDQTTPTNATAYVAPAKKKVSFKLDDLEKSPQTSEASDDVAVIETIPAFDDHRKIDKTQQIKEQTCPNEATAGSTDVSESLSDTSFNTKVGLQASSQLTSTSADDISWWASDHSEECLFELSNTQTEQKQPDINEVQLLDDKENHQIYRKSSGGSEVPGGSLIPQEFHSPECNDDSKPNILDVEDLTTRLVFEPCEKEEHKDILLPTQWSMPEQFSPSISKDDELLEETDKSWTDRVMSSSSSKDSQGTYIINKMYIRSPEKITTENLSSPTGYDSDTSYNTVDQDVPIGVSDNSEVILWWDKILTEQIKDTEQGKVAKESRKNHSKGDQRNANEKQTRTKLNMKNLQSRTVNKFENKTIMATQVQGNIGPYMEHMRQQTTGQQVSTKKQPQQEKITTKGESRERDIDKFKQEESISTYGTPPAFIIDKFGLLEVRSRNDGEQTISGLKRFSPRPRAKSPTPSGYDPSVASSHKLRPRSWGKESKQSSKMSVISNTYRIMNKVEECLELNLRSETRNKHTTTTSDVQAKNRSPQKILKNESLQKILDTLNDLKQKLDLSELKKRTCASVKTSCSDVSGDGLCGFWGSGEDTKRKFPDLALQFDHTNSMPARPIIYEGVQCWPVLLPNGTSPSGEHSDTEMPNRHSVRTQTKSKTQDKAIKVDNRRDKRGNSRVKMTTTRHESLSRRPRVPSSEWDRVTLDDSTIQTREGEKPSEAQRTRRRALSQPTPMLQKDKAQMEGFNRHRQDKIQKIISPITRATGTERSQSEGMPLNKSQRHQRQNYPQKQHRNRGGDTNIIEDEDGYGEKSHSFSRYSSNSPPSQHNELGRSTSSVSGAALMSQSIHWFLLALYFTFQLLLHWLFS